MWVDDMVRMGIIELEKPKTFPEIALTEYGIETYKKTAVSFNDGFTV